MPDELLALPALVGRTGALRPLLEPAWPFAVELRNRRGYALALVDTGRDRSRLLVDELRYPGRGRSHVGVVGDQLRSAGRLMRRAAVRVR